MGASTGDVATETEDSEDIEGEMAIEEIRETEDVVVDGSETGTMAIKGVVEIRDEDGTRKRVSRDSEVRYMRYMMTSTTKSNGPGGNGVWETPTENPKPH